MELNLRESTEDFPCREDLKLFTMEGGSLYLWISERSKAIPCGFNSIFELKGIKQRVELGCAG